MPAGFDAEVAELFRDLRAASNLTETDLAARIATPIEVVQALEQGAIYALPPWPETCRVVNAYGTLLNLDTRPLLRRIYAQLEAGIVELGPKAVPDVPVMPRQAGGNAGFGAGNAGQAPVLPPQAAPQAPAWPNGGQQPRPQQPQQPQWPGGGPQFGMPQQARQPAPGQAAWPNGPQPAAQPHARPAQPHPAQPQPQPQYQPAQGYPQQPQGYQPPPQDAPLQGDDAMFLDEPEPAPKSKKPALLKWGLGALIASVVLVGLWLALGDATDSSVSPGASGTSDPVLDPDDPRSRKADRLPNNF